MKFTSLLVEFLVALHAIALPAFATAQQAPPLDLKSIFDPQYQGWIRTHPDQFSWMILALISRPAPDSLQFTLRNGTRTNNVLWETWADDDFTFPKQPDPARPNQWSGRTVDLQRGLHLVRDPLSMFAVPAPSQNPTGAATRSSSQAGFIYTIPPNAEIDDEEVRRNEVSFEFITEQHLWFQEGIAAWIKDHPGKEMSFPRGAIEIKAIWMRAPANPDPQFHWNRDTQGNKYSLLALHIMTNAVPEWTWATFEWTGNDSQCDGAGGCSDRFGCEPTSSCIHSKADATGSSIKLADTVIKMFAQLGVTKEWTGYRLHGAQVLSDEKPMPNVLWNSQIESGFKSTSSCMACHRRASADVTGRADCSMGFFMTGPSCGQGHLDYPPDPPLAKGQTTTSFVWSFIKAYPAHSDSPVCKPSPQNCPNATTPAPAP